MTTNMLIPQTYSELERFAEKISKTDFIPKEYRGKPGDVLACIMYGQELGLGVMESLRSIAVINGKPSIFGDGMLALCQKQPVCEYVKETPLLENGNIVGYICEAKRRGEDVKIARFTLEDAKRAKLASKAGPWQEYPQRMLQMRARGFALRDAFADILKGIIPREEAMDYPQEQVQRKNNPQVEVAVDKKADPTAAPVEKDVIDRLTNEEEIYSVSPAQMIEVMQGCETVPQLRAYGQNMKAVYDKYEEADRNRVNDEYKRLMRIFAEAGT